MYLCKRGRIHDVLRILINNDIIIKLNKRHINFSELVNYPFIKVFGWESHNL